MLLLLHPRPRLWLSEDYRAGSVWGIRFCCWWVCLPCVAAVGGCCRVVFQGLPAAARGSNQAVALTTAGTCSCNLHRLRASLTVTLLLMHCLTVCDRQTHLCVTLEWRI
jgi:hypothetical protein